MTASNTCLVCHTPFQGRVDKRFCSDSCRAAFHNSKKDIRHALISRVNQQLLTNHKALLSFLDDEPFPLIDKQALIQKGFDAQYHTSRRIISGKVYYFCYDVGYTVVNPEQVMLRLLNAYSLGLENNTDVEEEIVEYGF